MDEEMALASKLALILPQLNERQRRTVLGAEAQALGRGGITRVARVAYMGSVLGKGRKEVSSEACWL